MDKHGNTTAQEGCDRCLCGSKYWENDKCIGCGARAEERTSSRATAGERSG